MNNVNTKNEEYENELKLFKQRLHYYCEQDFPSLLIKTYQ